MALTCNLSGDLVLCTTFKDIEKGVCAVESVDEFASF